jgi:hypothetical protein
MQRCRILMLSCNNMSRLQQKNASSTAEEIDGDRRTVLRAAELVQFRLIFETRPGGGP